MNFQLQDILFLQRWTLKVERSFLPLSRPAGTLSLEGRGDGATHSRQKIRDTLDRLLRCRQADSLQRAADVVLQPLQRQGQVRAAFVSHQGVNFVDDHRVDCLQRLAASFGGE